MPNPWQMIVRAGKCLRDRAVRTGQGTSRAIRSTYAQVQPRPIFVFGNQKSGTTAIAALLAEMTGRTVTLDLFKETKRPTYHRVYRNEMSIEAFVKRNKLDFSREIVKEPNLLVLYDKLQARFPDSPKVFVLRDPRDNSRSILNRLGFPGDGDPLLGPYRGVNARTWNLYLDGSWLGLESHDVIDALAARWNLAADTYSAHSEEMVLIRYEQFVEDKLGQIGWLADCLGLPRVNDISQRVDVPFQPAGDRTVRWSDFFGQHNLARLESRCRSNMKGLGYPLQLDAAGPDHSGHHSSNWAS